MTSKRAFLQKVTALLTSMANKVSPHFHLMLLFFQSSGVCVQSPPIIPVPGYPLCLVPHLRSLDDRFSYPVV